MDVEDVLLIVAFLFLIFGIGGWRLGIIDISKKGIDYGLKGASKSAKNLEQLNPKSVISTGSYVISVTNPQPGNTYETKDPATGITMTLTIITPDKFSVSIIGTRGDLHEITIELPDGCQYYYEEYLINSVSMNGVEGIRGYGITKDTKVKLTVLYRVIGNDETIIALFYPYAIG